MNLTQIKKEVEQATGIEDISTKSRDRKKVIARCIYSYLAYKNTTATYEKIGKVINRNHATILYSIDNLELHLLHEPGFKEIFNHLSESMRSRRLETFNNHQDRETMFRLMQEIPENKYKTVIKYLEAV